MIHLMEASIRFLSSSLFSFMTTHREILKLPYLLRQLLCVCVLYLHMCLLDFCLSGPESLQVM